MSSLALNYLINLLSRRDYSEFEIRNKMQEKAFTETEIEQALATAQQKNWQNDKRFAASYLYSRAQRGYGAQHIRQELRQLKGVQEDLVDEVMDESEIDWAQFAEQVLAKKFPNYQQPASIKEKQKIWRYMLSHGFYSEEFSDLIGNPD